MFLYKSYVSSGFCSSNHYQYGQVAAILSLLITTSTLVLLLITICDVGKGEEIHFKQTDSHSIEKNTVGAVKFLSIFYITIQALLLAIGLKSVICLESGHNFMLTVGVRERDTRRVTSYGATSQSNCPVNVEDITVYYHRLEPLSLPSTAWQLQGQILSLFLSFLIFCLYVSLTIADHFYQPLTVVSLINLLQQTVQLILTWIHSTDLAFCCPGISVTRWFIHQDFYTQMLQSIVLKKMKGSKPLGARKEWFSIDNEQEDEESEKPQSQGLDRAGEIRELQNLLENAHSLHYRLVFPGQEELVSLLLSYQEILALSQHFSQEDQMQDEENVIYSAETQLP